MEYKEECFAIRIVANTKKCIALNNINCENCKFYKSYEQHVKDLIKYPWDENKRRITIKEIYK